MDYAESGSVFYRPSSSTSSPALSSSYSGQKLYFSCCHKLKVKVETACHRALYRECGIIRELFRIGHLPTRDRQQVLAVEIDLCILNMRLFAKGLRQGPGQRHRLQAGIGVRAIGTR